MDLGDLGSDFSQNIKLAGSFMYCIVHHRFP